MEGNHSSHFFMSYNCVPRLLVSVLLHGDDLIVAHGGENTHNKGLASLEGGFDLTTKVIRVVGELDILTAVALIVHEGAELIGGDVDEGVILADHEGDVGSVGGGNDIFVLLASEDIDGGEVALGVTVLASLGGRHSTHLLMRGG
jgi:hypothetical protein